MCEFQINEYLSLKLEDGKTNIFVKNKLFRQCKFLLLEISINKISSFDKIDSVDEIENRYDRSQEFKTRSTVEIPPEVEFWGHCSNIQVWYEYDYDTRLIHSELAFPLLKRLAEVGDMLARKVFKEEIAKKFESDYWPTIYYLLDEGYDLYLSREELFLSLLGWNEEGIKQTRAILDLEKSINDVFYIQDYLSGDFNGIKIENHNVVELTIYYKDIESIPESIGNFQHLKSLSIEKTKIDTLPVSFENLKSLTILNLSRNKFKELPSIILRLMNIKDFMMAGNKIISIPRSINKLKNLEYLYLENNKIKILPDTMSDLSQLKELSLENNDLLSIPESISNLKSLEVLYLKGNNSLNLKNKVNNLPK